MANPVKIVKGAAKAITAGKKKAVQKANKGKGKNLTGTPYAVTLDKKGTMREASTLSRVKGKTRDFAKSKKPVNPATETNLKKTAKISNRTYSNAREMLMDRTHFKPSKNRSMYEQSAGKYQPGGKTVPVKKKGKK